MSDTHTIHRSQLLLLHVLEELERPATPARARALESLTRRLEPLLPRLEAQLPTDSERSYLRHGGAWHSVAQVSVRGDGVPVALRRRAVVRTLKLLDEALNSLPDHAPTALQRGALSLREGVSWFFVRHPILATLIILLLIIVLAWRQDFTLSTRFGTAEITIRGSRNLLRDGSDSAGIAPEAPLLETPQSEAIGPRYPADTPTVLEAQP